MYVRFEHPGHTYGGFVFAFSEWGMTQAPKEEGAPATATTEVDEDVDGGPHRRRCREPRQRPPPKLTKMSMVGPLGDGVGNPSNGHHRS
jgi:hypothetical protein